MPISTISFTIIIITTTTIFIIIKIKYEGASKLFRSATKGMLKAFGVKNSYGNTSAENIPVASNKMENRPSITPQETPVNNNNNNNKRCENYDIYYQLLHF